MANCNKRLFAERLGGTIQKIITIPAALQGISNPVPRIQHPDWLHKKVLEKNDVLKQRKISEMFTRGAPKPKQSDVFELSQSTTTPDIEEIGQLRKPLGLKNVSVSHQKKRKAIEAEQVQDLGKSWREVLGNPPPRAQVKAWITFQKKKWAYQMKQKKESSKRARSGGEEGGLGTGSTGDNFGVVRSGNRATLGGFLKRAQRTLLDTPWQIIQIMETGTPGMFRLWALVGSDLHQIKLVVPRVFYVNQRTAKDSVGSGDALWRKVTKSLPRSHPVLNLYEYRVPEAVYKEHTSDLVTDLSTPDVEGIYETQVSDLTKMKKYGEEGFISARDDKVLSNFVLTAKNPLDLSKLE